jgi:hypothetical protein
MSTKKTKIDIKDYWLGKAAKVLVGRKIQSINYLSKDECEEIGWFSRPIVITLDDGTIIYPVADDEGNDGGSIHYSKQGDTNYIIPVI